MILDLDRRLWYHVAWRPLIYLLIVMNRLSNSQFSNLILSGHLILSRIIPVFGLMYEIIKFKGTCSTHAEHMANACITAHCGAVLRTHVFNIAD